MDRIAARNMAGPLLLLNLIMYFIVLVFASWCLNRYIDGRTAHPSVGGNGATGHLLTFSVLAAVLGIVSKIGGGNHLRTWRNDSFATASTTSTAAWAVTALAFGLACKEINVGGWRGWRLRVVEAFIIILAFTQSIYVLLLHSSFYRSSAYDDDTGYGGGVAGAQPVHKGSATGGMV
ncbi:membrane protein PM19L-like [Salvia miltiorrhiza]|uniref:membrane protein PM19L-like n=1 Tax=Salvia miltiorrhiza TaxID=226208 RepID=UPI0025ACCEAD|nr:membrane protein PM19L-like [Salvia miltiorrhiza]